MECKEKQKWEINFYMYYANKCYKKKSQFLIWLNFREKLKV